MARHQLTYTRTQALAKAQAESAAAPRLSLAGEIDPVVALQNQLVRQQSLLDAYYANGSLSKTQYEALMQKTAQDSADAQYQAALALYGGQSRLHKLSLSLAETLRERTTNMLTGARSFKESLSGLFASLAQSVIKNLVDTAAQALITKTLFSSFMGGFGGGGRSAANAFSSGAYNGLSLNAKGGVYASRSLSAFSGHVVSQPTLFAFSHGAGLMGESGPEAIMPLKRGPDGSLGVQAVDGGGRGGDVIVNMGGFVFTTDERSDSAAGAGGMDVNGIANQLKPLIINVVNEQAGRQGSPLWYAIKGR